MSKKVIEPKLAELMNTVAECEGLIAADLEGNVIVGQTITEMDHGKIASECASILRDSQNLANGINKGSIKNTTIEFENGFAVIVGSEKMVLIALVGVDGKASLGLLKRNLSSIVNL